MVEPYSEYQDTTEAENSNENEGVYKDTVEAENSNENEEKVFSNKKFERYQ